jgi:hypothetical protein
VIAPVGSARADVDIVLGLARRLGLEDAFFGCSADGGHDAVLAPSGLSVAQLPEVPGGIELPEFPSRHIARWIRPARRVDFRRQHAGSKFIPSAFSVMAMRRCRHLLPEIFLRAANNIRCA